MLRRKSDFSEYLPARHVLQLALLAATVGLAGCGANPGATTQQAGAKFDLRRASLIDVPYTRLIDFELDSDLTFVEETGAEIVDATGGMGRRVLQPGAAEATLRLSSLLLGRAFPDRWNLLGVYVTPGQVPSRVRLSIVSRSRTLSERTVDLPGGTWSIAWLDIAEIDPASAADARLVIAFERPSRAALIDDIVLADNLLRQSAGEGAISMDAVRSGLNWRVTSGDGTASLPSTFGDRETGFELVLLTPMRAEFADSRGVVARVDRRGRVIVGGAMSADAASTTHHAKPGRALPIEESASTVRNSPGDADGDGYDQSTGVYRLRARRAVVRFRIEARGEPLPWPVVEVENLPPGQVRATVDGVLVQAIDRLADGRVLVELPVVVEDSADVELRVVSPD